MFSDWFNFESSLWDDFQRLQREVDALFNPGGGRASLRAVARGSFPAANIGVTPGAVHVYVFAPGLDTHTLDLSIQNNLLTIAGERHTPAPVEGADYYRQERFSGSFRRVISLPEDVDPNQVQAVYRNGLLDVLIGKQAVAKPRQIAVQNA
jgi:HSP20 family protein